MVKIYLAGAVDGQPDTVVYDWRYDATDRLGHMGLVAVVPPALGHGHDWPPNKIVLEDLASLRSCDAVLANVTVPSFGTGAELYYAHSIGKPIVAYTIGQPRSLFVKHFAGQIYHSLREAVGILVEMYGSQNPNRGG